MVTWWVNAIAGMACLALGINFIAKAYGLRLGGEPWFISSVTAVDPQKVGGYVPLTQNNGVMSDELRETLKNTRDDMGRQ